VTHLAPADTIAAIATPPGRGALAIVRLSGPDAMRIGETLARPWPAEARHMALTRIVDANGDALDEAMIAYFRGPSSFTGEDVVEITCHGGPIVAATIVAAAIAAGARPADAGEFTRRAVLNGRLDLVQAEAVGDLVDAVSRPAQQVALAQLDGGLSRRITELRDAVLGLEALAAYDIDFPEEDDGPVPAARIVARAREVIAEVDALLATAPLGEVVRDGAVVVIAGAPNVGKSSLFNALLGRRRAIVTDIPGTTRDALEALTEADGWPVRLVDTAGLRDTGELVERMGIEVSREYLERADVVLMCGDSVEQIRGGHAAIDGHSRAPSIDVLTKSDLHPANGTDAIEVSAQTGSGLQRLAAAIGAALRSSKGALRTDAPLITRERQRVALGRAAGELRAFADAWEHRTLPAIVSAVHLRDATRHLEELIGAVDIEDVLDRVFSSFCVGK
jgi:tRNA modification GTPase